MLGTAGCEYEWGWYALVDEYCDSSWDIIAFPMPYVAAPATAAAGIALEEEGLLGFDGFDGLPGFPGFGGLEDDPDGGLPWD